jgi:hypothetical protein
VQQMPGRDVYLDGLLAGRRFSRLRGTDFAKQSGSIL